MSYKTISNPVNPHALHLSSLKISLGSVTIIFVLHQYLKKIKNDGETKKWTIILTIFSLIAFSIISNYISYKHSSNLHITYKFLNLSLIIAQLIIFSDILYEHIL
mgnify:CR=1 FL=1